MWPFLSLTQSLSLCSILALLGAVFLRVLHRAAWRRRGLRLAYVAVFAILLAAHAAWSVGLDWFVVSYWGAIVASVGLIVTGFGVASLPLAALVRVVFAFALLRKAPPAPSHAPLMSRRAFVGAATAMVPLGAMGTAAGGFSAAVTPTALRTIPVTFPKLRQLHPALEGFSILQLSDLHLGAARNVRDLERFFEGLTRRPDLIVFTGDIADDLNQLGPALHLAHQFRARCGVLASLGNHEYLHDVRRARAIFDASPVPLLVDTGTTLRVGGASLYVAGANDPVVIRTNIQPFLEGSIDRALGDAPSDAFRLLLSHRPEGFDPAARHGVDLTLSGHTHGGQIGFNGKSAFEPLWPDGYLWGAYRRGTSRLYTTSGFGDWFPFRIGCSTEAPLVVLTSERTSISGARSL
ncbi:metallophosphoesterase [Pendulispora brunnea]|uniref:Metallophosphoesterase n=1 Tax=Pendulispora brunnea TaxID=2905690 RepID=A0ABZ2JZF7_9BACT